MLNLLQSVVSDIVVNSLVTKEGFAMPSSYIVEDSQATQVMTSRGVDPYLQQSTDPLFQQRFIAAKYLMAWGTLKYCMPDKEASATLQGFLQAFEHAFPVEFNMARQLQNAIERHDIFTPAGYDSAVEEALVFWGLNNVVKENPAS
jgi:hypothetical protein